jgi:hypothetical protein
MASSDALVCASWLRTHVKMPSLFANRFPRKGCVSLGKRSHVDLGQEIREGVI